MTMLPETPSDRLARHRALILLAALSCAVRLVYSAAVYLQNTGNAAWIEAMGGSVLSMPALLLVGSLLRKKNKSGAPASLRLQKFFCLLFIPFFSFDASSWVFALAESASYTTFADESLYFLYLPALITVTLIVSRGGNACGALAKGILWVVAVMLGVAMIWQAEQLHPVWLTPMLGSGIEPIARGSALCGGYAALYPIGLWVLLRCGEEPPDEAAHRRLLRALPIAGLTAALFLLFYGALTPNIPDAPHIRSFAMERLLTGGGRSTSVHFPSLLSWYALLLVSAVYSLFCTACALHMLLPKASFLLCAALGGLMSLLWTPVRLFWKHGEDLLVFANIVVVTVALLILYGYETWKRRNMHAKP
ncbi:MAG: hypothetical protein Q4A66_07960 [Eubacteriales bacterium]|nr:hypothetical protein [Eubacteriales bacterium]